MFESLRETLAFRVAARAARRRTPGSWRARLHERRLLIVLPQEEGALHEAWELVRSLDLAPERVAPVALAGPVAYVPDAYAGRVRLLDAAERNRLGVPHRAAVEALWRERPDVAVDLSAPFGPASALIVGGAPAALRVGLYDPRAEPYYDLLVAPGREPAAEAVGRYLAVLEPPALPFLEPA